LIASATDHLPPWPELTKRPPGTHETVKTWGENKADQSSRSLIIPLSLSSGRTDGQSAPQVLVGLHGEWGDTVLVRPRERVRVAFVADNPGVCSLCRVGGNGPRAFASTMPSD
jgi:hypothetical protein